MMFLSKMIASPVCIEGDVVVKLMMMPKLIVRPLNQIKGGDDTKLL